MSYVKPNEVKSPKTRWYLFEIIKDKGEGKGVYALGEWDGERRIGFRWNGTEENPLGNPQSRGLATWTMLDLDLHKAVIALLPNDDKPMAKKFLRL